MEKVSGLELDWYFEQFVETTNTIDYGIKSVNSSKEKTKIILTRNGDIPMPIDLIVRLTDGSVHWYYIPLRIMRGEKGKDIYSIKMNTLSDWPWVYPEYTFELNFPFDQIKEINIDPSGRLADLNQDDNSYLKKSNESEIQFKGH